MTDPNGTYLLHPEHINVMLWAGLGIAAADEPVFWPVLDTEASFLGRDELTPTTADRIGQMLVDTNAEAVNTQHGQDHAYVYAYREPRYPYWSDIEVIKAVHFYEWQGAQLDNWITSPAFFFCRALTERLIQRCPGYAEAASHITEAHLPQRSGHWPPEGQ